MKLNNFWAFFLYLKKILVISWWLGQLQEDLLLVRPAARRPPIGPARWRRFFGQFMVSRLSYCWSGQMQGVLSLVQPVARRPSIGPPGLRCPPIGKHGLKIRNAIDQPCLVKKIHRFSKFSYIFLTGSLFSADNWRYVRIRKVLKGEYQYPNNYYLHF